MLSTKSPDSSPRTQLLQHEVDDDDLYSNLPDFQHEKLIKRLESSNEKLKKKVRYLEESVRELKRSNAKLCKVEQALKRNISVLYATAIAEISAKDNTIAELERKHNSVIFRRQQRVEDRQKSDLSAIASTVVPSSSHFSSTPRDKETLGVQDRTFEPTSSSSAPRTEASKSTKRSESSMAKSRDNEESRVRDRTSEPTSSSSTPRSETSKSTKRSESSMAKPRDNKEFSGAGRRPKRETSINPETLCKKVEHSSRRSPSPQKCQEVSNVDKVITVNEPTCVDIAENLQAQKEELSINIEKTDQAQDVPTPPLVRRKRKIVRLTGLFKSDTSDEKIAPDSLSAEDSRLTLSRPDEQKLPALNTESINAEDTKSSDPTKPVEVQADPIPSSTPREITAEEHVNSVVVTGDSPRRSESAVVENHTSSVQSEINLIQPSSACMDASENLSATPSSANKSQNTPTAPLVRRKRKIVRLTPLFMAEAQKDENISGTSQSDVEMYTEKIGPTEKIVAVQEKEPTNFAPSTSLSTHVLPQTEQSDPSLAPVPKFRIPKFSDKKDSSADSNAAADFGVLSVLSNRAKQEDGVTPNAQSAAECPIPSSSTKTEVSPSVLTRPKRRIVRVLQPHESKKENSYNGAESIKKRKNLEHSIQELSSKIQKLENVNTKQKSENFADLNFTITDALTNPKILFPPQCTSTLVKSKNGETNLQCSQKKLKAKDAENHHSQKQQAKCKEMSVDPAASRAAKSSDVDRHGEKRHDTSSSKKYTSSLQDGERSSRSWRSRERDRYSPRRTSPGCLDHSQHDKERSRGRDYRHESPRRRSSKREEFKSNSSRRLEKYDSSRNISSNSRRRRSSRRSPPRDENIERAFRHLKYEHDKRVRSRRHGKPSPPLPREIARVRHTGPRTPPGEPPQAKILAGRGQGVVTEQRRDSTAPVADLREKLSNRRLCKSPKKNAPANEQRLPEDSVDGGDFLDLVCSQKEHDLQFSDDSGSDGSVSDSFSEGETRQQCQVASSSGMDAGLDQERQPMSSSRDSSDVNLSKDQGGTTSELEEGELSD